MSIVLLPVGRREIPSQRDAEVECQCLPYEETVGEGGGGGGDEI